MIKVTRGQKQQEVKRNAKIILILACIQASFSIYHHTTSTRLETLKPLEMIAETVLITLYIFWNEEFRAGLARIQNAKKFPLLLTSRCFWPRVKSCKNGLQDLG